MFQMLLPGITEDDKIINEYLQEMSHEVMEDVPHYPLECTWGIAQSKRHSIEGIGSPISDECGVDLVLGLLKV